MQLHQYTLVYMLQLGYQPNMKRITNAREAGRLFGRVHPLISSFITKERTLQHRRILQRTLQTMQPCTFSLAEHLMHPLQSASALHPLISFFITKRRTLQLGRIRRWTLQPAHSDWRILKIWRAEWLHVLRAGLRFHNAESFDIRRSV